MKKNQKMISGKRAGVQSCDKTEANVFVELNGDGVSHYARMNFDTNTVEMSDRSKEAVKFVEKHFTEFKALCLSLA